MYTPPAFAVEERAWAAGIIDAYPFATLITFADGAPQLSHVPVLAEERDGALWLIGHVASANPHAAEIGSGSTRATIVFAGPHAYVSAAWYEAPYESVPTWNYTAVHCEGTLQESDGYRALALLTAKFEAHRDEPWRMERLDLDSLQKQLRGIVAFEMRVDELRAKAKLSQNRTPADRERVAARLEASSHELDRACGTAVRKAFAP